MFLCVTGFKDSAITFQQESHAARSDDVLRPTIRPGALIHLIQRGLQYLECAALVNKARFQVVAWCCAGCFSKGVIHC